MDGTVGVGLLRTGTGMVMLVFGVGIGVGVGLVEDDQAGSKRGDAVETGRPEGGARRLEELGGLGETGVIYRGGRCETDEDVGAEVEVDAGPGVVEERHDALEGADGVSMGAIRVEAGGGRGVWVWVWVCVWVWV